MQAEIHSDGSEQDLNQASIQMEAVNKSFASARKEAYVNGQNFHAKKTLTIGPVFRFNGNESKEELEVMYKQISALSLKSQRTSADSEDIQQPSSPRLK
jgi:hypothetical protein